MNIIRALQATSVSVMTLPMFTILIMDFSVFWSSMEITLVYVRLKKCKHTGWSSFLPCHSISITKDNRKYGSKQAQGWNNIPTMLLRIGSRPLAQTLTWHINCAFEKATYPDTLKLTEVSSQFKKNDNLSGMNYRPVSILTAISKACERAKSSQLIVYFDKIFLFLLCAFRKATQLRVGSSSQYGWIF